MIFAGLIAAGVADPKFTETYFGADNHRSKFTELVFWGLRTEIFVGLSSSKFP